MKSKGVMHFHYNKTSRYSAHHSKCIPLKHTQRACQPTSTVPFEKGKDAPPSTVPHAETVTTPRTPSQSILLQTPLVLPYKKEDG